MLGVSEVQIPENNLDNLKLTREEDGDFKTVDPQCLLASKMLEGLDPKILGSTLVEVILVKWHVFPTIVKAHPVGFDVLALVELFILVECNTELIERDVEVTLRLQAELDEELIARMDADYELAARMTQEEQEKYTIEERASQLKGKSYAEIQGLYERQQMRIQDFTPMDSEKEAQKPGKRLKRVAGSYATQKSPKKPKVMKSAKDVTEEEAAEYEKEKEELRADGSLSYHGDTQAFLRRLDRQDLNDLYSCGVHTLFMDGTPMEINMLVEKKYPLIKELPEKMLTLQLDAEEESTMAFELIKFIKSLIEE
ncbi:hypothetical protein Tco_1051276 [Tanacetum coccineum]